MTRVSDTLAKLQTQSWDQQQPDLRAVLCAAATLRFTDPQLLCLVHGDWHLGQMVSIRHNGKDSWRLIDVDDLGLGDPAWDLARPAAFFAAGLIDPDDWNLFLDSYRAAGGPAVESFKDPWQSLDMPARALVVQCAAAALIRSQQSHTPLSDADLHLVEVCRRINFEEKKP
jgi:aminoglycoside phosphotransferase (APT) family kinase protein